MRMRQHTCFLLTRVLIRHVTGKVCIKWNTYSRLCKNETERIKRPFLPASGVLRRHVCLETERDFQVGDLVPEGTVEAS